ncbi:MAG: hypothetical protein MJZ96_07695 [Paludibacteraceae bacterium]|nr:hypothetical protein [Paludibacteraceae bacterium]
MYIDTNKDNILKVFQDWLFKSEDRNNCILPAEIPSYKARSQDEIFLANYDKSHIFEYEYNKHHICSLPFKVPYLSIYRAEQIENSYLCAFKDEGFCLFDSNGNIIIKPHALIEHIGGDFFVCFDDARIEDKYDDEDRTHQYYLVSTSLPNLYFKGKQIASGSYFYNDGYLFVNTNEEWHVFDNDGQLRFIQDYNGWSIKGNDGLPLIDEYFISIIYNKKIIVALISSGCGAWNHSGENILPPMNESITIFPDALMYQIDGKTGVSLYDGKQILLPKYKFIKRCVHYGLPTNPIEYPSEPKGFDSDTSDFLSESNSEFNNEDNLYYIFSDQNENLIFTINKGIIGKTSYNIRCHITEDFFLVEQENKLGVFSTKDQELVIPCDYDRIRYDGTIYICSYLLENTKVFEYKSHDIIYNGECIFCELEKIFCIDKNFYSVKNKEEGYYFIFCVDDTNNTISTFTDYYDEYCRNFKGSCHQVFHKNQVLTEPLGTINNQRWYFSNFPIFLEDNYLLVSLHYFIEYHNFYELSTKTLTDLISEEIKTKVNFDFDEKIKQPYSFNLSVQKEALFRYDDNSKELTPCLFPKYDEILQRKDGNFDVRIGKSWGIASPEGIELTRIKYKEKVYDIVVRDAETNKIGILSDDYSVETIPTIYDTIIYDDDEEIGVYDIYDAPLFDLDLLTHKPIAVGKATKTEHKYDERRNEQSIYIDDYEIFDMWSLANIKYAIIDCNKNHCVELIYDRIRIKGSYLIAFGPEIEEFKVNTNIDRYKHLKKRSFVDIYSQSQEKIYSVKDANVTIDLFHHAEIIEFKDDTPFIKKFHSLNEGWDIQFIINQNTFFYPISENLFIKYTYSEDHTNTKYNVLDRFGQETPVQYMFCTYPIEGWFFAAMNQGDDYVVVLIHQDALDKEIIVYKDITLADLLNIVESNGLYLGSKIDIETNEYFDKSELEFKQWITELKEDFGSKNNYFVKDDFGDYFYYYNNYQYDKYWISRKLAEVQLEKEKEDDDNDDNDNDYSSDYYDATDYNRDTWYALTDGQCGEYPGSSSADDVYDGLGW